MNDDEHKEAPDGGSGAAAADQLPADDRLQGLSGVVAHRSWKRSLILGVTILLCGAVMGGVVTALVIEERPTHRRPWDRMPEQIAERMQQKYGLTDEQTKQLVAVFQEHWKKLSEIRAEVQPRVAAEHEALRSTVETILTPEQAAEWRKEFEQMQGLWRRPGGDPQSAEKQR